MNDAERTLLYEAGYLAGHLHWPDPDVIAASEIPAMAPVGDPVILLCGDQGLTIAQARNIAAISGAGRAVRVVTTRALPSEVTAWLPSGSIHEVGANLTLSTTAEDYASSVREAYLVDMESWLSPGDADPEELVSTTIALNWDVAWWALSGSLHLPDDNQEWFFERYDPIPAIHALFALPFLVGDSGVLGESTPEGQYFPSADCLHVISGNWHRIDFGSGEEWVQYRSGHSGFSRTVVSHLMSLISPRDPDPLFPDNVRMEETFTNVIRGMLEGITLGLLKHGSAGFDLMKPHLASWVEQCHHDAVEVLRGMN